MNITRHPNYSGLTKKNDIALIRLTTKIYFTNTIRPACLHTDIGDLDTHMKLTVTGWGDTDPDPNIVSLSNELRKIEIYTMSLGECNTTYMNHDALKNLREIRDGLDLSQYCVHDPAGTKDSCQGDSGGPLLLIPDNDPNKATIVGIVSFSHGCALNLPSIYTRVAHYTNWIESIVWPQN
ncbi:serine protease Hayan-like isoform X2 [Contarinia nasturtii]|uniref:serine protease Hayan-like isoform X2 n=1 Tax=Contarinia nasturtii TaxID=265458 RepID=UPI0012D3747F|nr:serine protease Hayan-like isoform X2 [Contarinia nasturtii]